MANIPGAVTDPRQVHGEEIQFKSGEDTIKGYLARPAQGGSHPGIVVIHEAFGLVEHICAQRARGMVHRLGERFEMRRAILVLLQADERHGVAMLGRVRAATRLPALRHIAGGGRVGLGQAQATLIGGFIAGGVARRRAGRATLRRDIGRRW